MSDWNDRIVGARMAVDREFEGRIADSEFSRQQWGLVMTATEFEIEHPASPERARVVANTAHLPSVVPELERMESETAGVPGGGGRSGGGLIDSLKGALGLGDDEDAFGEAKTDRAEALVAEYAQRLQTHLKEDGRWEEICAAAASDRGV
ncbi:DUF5799 family protein [Halomarina ordinaria]|uniref:DUF5799 family protein n=1 Tax=Halomarina ordinaria TaxID=3033939 RepID=A0ABD5U8D3_9EURY|nr:DUF5799 family protein [Halomarina sp. PSRA2]